jgi:translation initiation factor 2 beta subunit (eIF-2beta)/eIF-5
MEKEFKYKSGEYANKLGISKEALRSRRRRGELENEYIIKDGITLWREPASSHGKKPGGQSCSNPAPRSKIKRIGVHVSGQKTNYPNYAMQQHNELKMLAKLQRNVDPELQELLPEAIEQAKRIKEQRQQELQRELINKRPKSYGRMYNPKLSTPTWDEFEPKPQPKKYKYYD